MNTFRLARADALRVRKIATLGQKRRFGSRVNGAPATCAGSDMRAKFCVFRAGDRSRLLRRPAVRDSQAGARKGDAALGPISFESIPNRSVLAL
jgi:hypothetical protein